MRILLLCIVTAFAVGRAGAAGGAAAEPGEVLALGGEPDSAELRAKQVAVADARRIYAAAMDDVRAARRTRDGLRVLVDARERARDAFRSADVAISAYLESLDRFHFTGERGMSARREYRELQDLSSQLRSACRAVIFEIPSDDLSPFGILIKEPQRPATEVIQAAVSAEDKALAAAIMDRVSAQDLSGLKAERLPEMVAYFDKLHIFSYDNILLGGYHAKADKEKEKAIARALKLLSVGYQAICRVTEQELDVNGLHVCQKCGAFVSPAVIQSWKNKCPYCMQEPLLVHHQQAASSAPSRGRAEERTLIFMDSFYSRMFL